MARSRRLGSDPAIAAVPLLCRSQRGEWLAVCLDYAAKCAMTTEGTLGLGKPIFFELIELKGAQRAYVQQCVFQVLQWGYMVRAVPRNYWSVAGKEVNSELF